MTAGSPPVLATAAEIMPKLWQYGNAQGGVFSSFLKLEADGSISGYRGANESGWRYEAGDILLLRHDGSLFCRLAPRRGSAGELIFAGGPGLLLTERRPETPLYPLTLQWSPRVEQACVQKRVYLNFPGLVSGVYQYGETITLPNQVIVEPYACMPWRGFVSAGAFSYCVGKTLEPNVTIGRYCSIAPDVELMGPQHPLGHVSTGPVTYHPHYREIAKADFGTDFHVEPFRGQWLGPPRIGNDVWIGNGAMLKGDITIGDGAVIGARSVVTKNVSPYAVVAGNPGRVVKYRFPAPLIERLLRLRWWRYNFINLPACWREPVRFCDELELRLACGSIQPYTPEKIDLGRELLLRL